MKIIPPIWFMFTILFACFSVYHFVKLYHSYPRFEWEAYKGDLDSEFLGAGQAEIEMNLSKFITQWNEYIDEQNKSSFRLNLIAAISYLFAAIMSGIAMFIPGPHNIRDTGKYLYGKCIQSKLCRRLFRHINQEENKSDDIK